MPSALKYKSLRRSVTEAGGSGLCVLRPVRELKGFVKLSLEPGATSAAEFVITRDDLKFYDESSHAWVDEPGTFKACVAASSADIKSTVPFRLTTEGKLKK